MSRDIDISLLRAFTAVVDTGSVTAAARLLNRTQAAVSLQVKRLEETLGQELFRREHRKLTLSTAGERLLASAQRIVALNDAMVGQMTTREFEGEVRFGIPADIVRTYIPPILRRFHGSWPRVRLTMTVANSQGLVEAFDGGELDIVLSTDVDTEKRAETLRRDRLVWIGAPDGTAHQLTPLPLAIGDNTCRFRPVVLESLRRSGRDWRLVLEATRQVAQEAVVVAGLAVTAVLRDSLPEGFEILGADSGLPPLPEFNIDMYVPPVGNKPIVDSFADHVRAEFKARYGGDGVGQATKVPRVARRVPA
ncbi:MAG TPA: LysR substrate-binding domain-containing protein [Hyphomicrobiaceae bacterium]|nr:LysR substrate-binding domain-containing protein [Hyphomicrobiaceae bacterium]